MVEIRRVLCPVDRSDESRHALEAAVALARWYGAGLRVLEVVSVPMAPLLMTRPEVRGLTVELRAKVLQALDAFVTSVGADGLAVETAVEEGDLAPAILRVAGAWPADLVVVGTHGRSGFERFTMGSVAEKVLRQAGRPVLVVPPREAAQVVPGTPPFKRILCATDFSDESREGVAYALSLARESDAEIVLAHVVDWPAYPDLPETLRAALGGTHEAWRQDRRRDLDALVPADARDWCRPDVVVRTGSPAREILQLAAERSSDVIVMGIRGRGAVSLALYGSTVQTVVRASACPVLAVGHARDESRTNGS